MKQALAYLKKCEASILASPPCDISCDAKELREIQSEIKELEELVKPKSCETCTHRSLLHETLTNQVTNGFCVENGFFTKRGFCCNRYDPKDA